MKTIARSTADAESAALAACVADALFCREFLSEIGIYRRDGGEYDTKTYDPYDDTQVDHPPTVIYCDNQATIKMAARAALLQISPSTFVSDMRLYIMRLRRRIRSVSGM